MRGIQNFSSKNHPTEHIKLKKTDNKIVSVPPKKGLIIN